MTSLTTTVTKGIFQSDVIIRSAIIQGIADIRANEWLLDYIFVSLAQDSLTAGEYGQKEIDKAKKWFKSNNFPVTLNINPQEPTIPCITIALQESVEIENTLGDVNPYQVAENDSSTWPIVIGPFTPTNYDPTTGTVTIDSDLVDVDTQIFEGMIVIDRKGNQYTISEMVNAYTFILEEGLNADLTGAVIKSASPCYVLTLESANFKESYSIGVYVNSEPVYATYLHSIVVYILLRYRQSLLEARGFERSVISSSDLRENEAFKPQNVYSRFITITGFVRQYWVKDRVRKIDGIVPQILPSVGDQEVTFTEITDMDQDALAGL